MGRGSEASEESATSDQESESARRGPKDLREAILPSSLVQRFPGCRVSAPRSQ